MPVSAVASAATSTSLLASGDMGRWVIISNDDANRLYVCLDSATASTDNYSFYLESGESSVPIPFAGEIRGIWAADGAGKARVTTWGA
jgi:hypothetical protein